MYIAKLAEGWWGAYSAALPPALNPPAAKLASQGDAQVRTDAQIKFLYYPLATPIYGKLDIETGA